MSSTEQDQPQKSLNIVMGNSSADMDSIMSAIAYAKSSGPNYLPLINISREDLNLRKDVLYVFDVLGINPSQFLYREDLPELTSEAKQGKVAFTLIDHNILDPRQKELIPFVEKIIDHHKDETEHLRFSEIHKNIQTVGSTATLVAQEILDKSPESLTSEISFILLSSILLDTNNLEDINKTTSLDIATAQVLKAKAKDLYNPHLFSVLSQKKQEIDPNQPDAIIKKDFKIYEEGKLYYGISSLPVGIKWSDENEALWKESVREFLQREKLDLWIGLMEEKEAKKELIFYSPNQKLLQALMVYFPGNRALNPYMKFKAFLSDENLLFYELNKPLARKELQPFLSLSSSPLIQSADREY